MTLLYDSDDPFLNRYRIDTAKNLADIGFDRFYIHTGGFGSAELVAQARFVLFGIQMTVSLAERADLRVIVGDDNVIFSDESHNSLENVTSIEQFAKIKLAEWTRIEFTDDDLDRLSVTEQRGDR